MTFSVRSVGDAGGPLRPGDPQRAGRRGQRVQHRPAAPQPVTVRTEAQHHVVRASRGGPPVHGRRRRAAVELEVRAVPRRRGPAGRARCRACAPAGCRCSQPRATRSHARFTATLSTAPTNRHTGHLHRSHDDSRGYRRPPGHPRVQLAHRHRGRPGARGPGAAVPGLRRGAGCRAAHPGTRASTSTPSTPTATTSLIQAEPTGEVVGTYRMLPPGRRARLYSDGEFDLRGLTQLRPGLVETGRSCVARRATAPVP